MIHNTYGKQQPQVRRLQGGILVPVNIETVTLEGEEGPEEFYRCKLLKFQDDGSDISDLDAFTKCNQAPVNAQLNGPVDVQLESPRHPEWMEKAKDKIAGEVVRLESELTDNERQGLIEHYEVWETGKDYIVDQVVKYNGGLFKVLQAHTSQSDWTPDTATSLFTEVVPPSVIPEWEQPSGAHDAYNTGDKVTFEGQIYESTIDDNVWSPTEYPQGWKDLGAA